MKKVSSLHLNTLNSLKFVLYKKAFNDSNFYSNG